MRRWVILHRTELLIFLLAWVLLALFSGSRFLRQSGAPHFIYQAQAWLQGRPDIDPAVLPNLEDWACVREMNGRKVRCEGPALPSDRWYVSFPPFPALLMLPFVALHGYQLNDTSFTVFLAALALVFFFRAAQRLSVESQRTQTENAALTGLLGFGTLFFYCAIRGEVWFTAEVLGAGLTSLYLSHAFKAHRPVWAGLFFAMATLTRTPLVFSGLFFVVQAIQQQGGAKAVAKRLVLFSAGAAPLAISAAGYNFYRFGSLGEFGHRFLYNNRVNADIDRFGLFHLHYLVRNLEAAFLALPRVSLDPFRLGYDPHGLSLLLTMPWLLLLLIPRARSRLQGPLWATVAVCALPGLFYQNTGYMQFGFRFSLDYTPYLVLLLAVSGWSLRTRWPRALIGLGVAVNLWGALAFRGYTEYIRQR